MRNVCGNNRCRFFKTDLENCRFCTQCGKPTVEMDDSVVSARIEGCSCGRSIKSGDKFCGWCGKDREKKPSESNPPLQPTKESLKMPNPNCCPNCEKSLLMPGQKICPHCGYQLNLPIERICPACGEPMAPEWNFCVKCGASSKPLPIAKFHAEV